MQSFPFVLYSVRLVLTIVSVRLIIFKIFQRKMKVIELILMVQGVCLNMIFLSNLLKSSIFITLMRNMAHSDRNTHTFVNWDKNWYCCHENMWNFYPQKLAIFFRPRLERVLDTRRGSPLASFRLYHSRDLKLKLFKIRANKLRETEELSMNVPSERCSDTSHATYWILFWKASILNLGNDIDEMMLTENLF